MINTWYNTLINGSIDSLCQIICIRRRTNLIKNHT